MFPFNLANDRTQSKYYSITISNNQNLVHMKKIIKYIYLFSVLMLFVAGAFAQGKVTGKVVDNDNDPLPGANIILKGTTYGVITGIDGSFKIDVPQNTGTLTISFIGFESASVKFDLSKTADLGSITLESDEMSIQDVIVIGSGVIDVAANRETPIAASMVTKVDIQAKAVGNVEFPEVMKNTPNVYVTNQSGGFGDSQMFLRGFDQSNTAFLLNGQPINGMEDGNMYWSNWAGMSDIANAVDIQRGLGSSKLAISSVGGTVNIITKATEKKKGGLVRFVGGNGLFGKGTVAYNTGRMDNGWGISVMLDYWQGDRKWADGTKGKGQNYFLSVGKELGDHNFNLLIFGAPQWHDQNFSKSQDLYDQYGLKYNNNWGYKDGEYMTWRRNYYHKPVMNLNWDWKINDISNLSTVLYASFGRGGGTGPYGSSKQYNLFDANGQIDYDQVVANNEALDGKIGTYGTAAALRASVNNHQWYGAVTNYQLDINDNLSMNVGADLRFYNGDHFRELVDLLGLNGWEDSYGRYTSGDYIVSNTYNATPWASLMNFAPEKDRIAYDNSEWINYQGVFGQAEYAVDNFSVFFQGALSNQSYKKEERFSADHAQSETLNRIGYDVKAGASYSLTENHIVFANFGFYSRQPFLDNIFEYGSIIKRAKEVANEQITGIELGYKAKIGDKTNVILNGYYTKWANRFLSSSTQDYVPINGGDTVSDAGIRMYNIAQVHKGVELEVNTAITNSWKVRGYATFGDWRYAGSTPVEVVDMDKNSAVVDKFDIDLNGAKVGEAPQMSLGLGTTYRINDFRVWADFNYYNKLYGFVDVEDMAIASFNGKTYESEKLNGYGIVDAGISYTLMQKKSNSLILRANVYNLLNTKYISRKDSYGYYYGNGTTFNFGLTYSF